MTTTRTPGPTRALVVALATLACAVAAREARAQTGAATVAPDTLLTLTAGFGATCLATTAGAAYCWHNGTGGGPARRMTDETGAPATLRAIATFGEHRCAIDFHDVIRCDVTTVMHLDRNPGQRTFPQACAFELCLASIPDAGPFAIQKPSAITVGEDHQCVLDAQGAAYCWGMNDYGQLGIGAWSPGADPRVLAPTAVAGPNRFTHLEGGSHFTCGLTKGAAIYCWGAGTGGADSTRRQTCIGGQGISNTTCSNATPLPVVPEAQRGDAQKPWDVRFADIDAGLNVACGLTVNGAVYCWGANMRCVLGDCRAPEMGPARHIALPGKAIGIAAGMMSACAVLIDRRLMCWGDNSNGELGSAFTINADSAGNPPDYRDLRTSRRRREAENDPCPGGGRCSPIPVEVSGGMRWTAVAAGAGHVCGLATDRKVYCWGGADNAKPVNGSSYIECADGRPAPGLCRRQPTPVVGLPPIVAGANAVATAVALAPLVALSDTQGVGMLRGTVRDSATGNPLPGTQLSVNCSYCHLDVVTDSQGRYAIADAPVGRRKITVQCSRGFYRNRWLVDTTAIVGEDSTSVVDIAMPLVRCELPIIHEQTAVFTGFWRRGVGESSFRLCPSSALSFPNDTTPVRIWAQFPSTNRRRPAWPPTAIEQNGVTEHFVEVKGRLRGPEKFGPKNAFNYLVLVDSIIRVLPANQGKCK